MVGTADVFEPVLAALLAGVAATGDHASAVPGQTSPRWRGRCCTAGADSPGPRARSVASLDDYVEAQVHGTLDLAYDVEELVVDPSFAGTPTGATLESIARAVRFRPALAPRLRAGRRPGRRGVPGARRSRVLAARVHREFARSGDPVDAALIGRAAASVVAEPHRWADRGPIADTLQHLKQLWHVLVRFGAPYGT